MLPYANSLTPNAFLDVGVFKLFSLDVRASITANICSINVFAAQNGAGVCTSRKDAYGLSPIDRAYEGWVRSTV